jgi:thioredoxin-related protein
MIAPIRPILSLTTGLAAVLCCSLAVAEPAATPGQLLGSKQTTYPDWFKDSFLELEEDIREAAAEGRRLIVFFHQDNCPYCNALIERNLSQKQIEEKIRRHYDVVALNLRGDRNVVSVDGAPYTEKDFARALNIQFTPTLLFLDENGNLLLRLNGYVPPREFEAALDYASGGTASRGLTFREYSASVMPPGSSGDLNQASFFSGPPYDLGRTIDGDRPVAVFFEQKQCPACDTLHREVLSDEDTVEILGLFQAVQLDMWSDQELITPSGENTTAREWAQDLDIGYAPTIVLFSPAGEEVIRLEATFKRFHAQSVFDYVASGAFVGERDFQRYLTDRADRIRATGQDVDIWK